MQGDFGNGDELLKQQQAHLLFHLQVTRIALRHSVRRRTVDSPYKVGARFAESVQYMFACIVQKVQPTAVNKCGCVVALRYQSTTNPDCWFRRIVRTTKGLQF